MGAHTVINDGALRKQISLPIGLFLCLIFLFVVVSGEKRASAEETAESSEQIPEELNFVEEDEDLPPTPIPEESNFDEEEEDEAVPPAPRPKPPEPIQITSVLVEGNTVIKTNRILRVLAPLLPYSMQEPRLTGLEKFIEAVTDLYHKKGYFLTQAYIPEQEIQNGVLKITVMEGSLGAVAVSGNAIYPSSFIKNHFHEGKVIAYPSFERAMLLLNGYDDLSASGIFQASAAPGSADFVVQVQDDNPLHYTLDYNNFGSKLVSRHRFGVGMVMGNLLRYGSHLSIRGMTGRPTSNMLYERVDYGIPLRFAGTRLNFMYAGGDSDIGKSLADLAITMEATGWGVSVEHPFILRRFSRLTGTLGLEGQDFQQSFEAVSLKRTDRIRLLHLDADYNKQTEGGHQNGVRIALRQGLGAVLGAMKDNDRNGSRDGADNQFFKGILEVVRLQRVTNHLSLAVQATGQFSSNPLVVGEQFAMGGPDSVRGYAVGEFLSDTGYTVSLEIQVSPFEGKNGWQTVFFVDQGEGSIKKPYPGEVQKGSFTGAGFGMRVHHDQPIRNGKPYPLSMDVMADIGYPLDDGPTTKVGAAYYVRAALRY